VRVSRSSILALAVGVAATSSCSHVGPVPDPADEPGEPAPAPEPGPDSALEAALDDAVVGVSDEGLRQLLRDHWANRLERSPLNATELGVHTYDDRLAEIGPGPEQRTRDERRAFLERAKDLDASALAPNDALSLRMFIEGLEQAEAAQVCEYSQWNLSARNNPVTAMNGIPQVHPLRTKDDLDHLLARYRQIPARIDGRIALLKQGAGRGLFANAESTRRVVDMAGRQLAQPVEEWPLMTPAEAEVEGLTADEREEFRGRSYELVKQEIQPALARWHGFLEAKILPHARDPQSTGLVALPQGPACYEAMVRRYTTLPLTADVVHETGLREMARINDEMRDLGKKLFGTRNLKKILKRLREDPKLYFETEEQVEAFATRALADAKAEMPAYFGILPKADCVVTRIPDYEAPYTTIAYYEPPHADGTKPGEYFINTTAPTTRPRYEARVLAYHEAIPGHHLQIAIAQELPEVPAFRRHGGRTVFVEGWALYTERLADEMGLYPEDLDRMGVLSFDAWRAGRLVVDTGIHAKGWSRQQAVDYLLEHTALAANNIDNEVDRYISWPGQAVAYKIGQLEIMALRRKAERKLGDAFELPAFHDVVLAGGAVPIAVLRERVDAWLAGDAAK
jgi:uncharacterized protein (DUF885 family)